MEPRPTDASRPDPGASTDLQGLGILDPAACLRLLDSVYVGRVAVVAGRLPTIRPVNFVRQGRDIVFRTAPGTLLAAARDGAPASFEVDGLDELYHVGWSVVVQGELRLVHDAAELEELARLPLRPWARAIPRPFWVRLRTEELSGRCIV